MIKYVIRAKRIPNSEEEIVRYHAQMAPVTPVSLVQIVKRIEKRSTVASADVKAVLDALQYEVIDALQNGNSVRLGDLGSFRLSIKSEGFDSSVEAKKAGASAIKNVKIQFTPSVAMKEALSASTAEFGLQADVKND